MEYLINLSVFNSRVATEVFSIIITIYIINIPIPIYITIVDKKFLIKI